MDEFGLIEWIKKKAGKVPSGWVGIGDDAAVIPSGPARNWILSTDTIVEGVDFDRKVTPAQAGRKALAINLSDMAAMGATPRAFLMTLGIPLSWKRDIKLKSFLKGLFNLAQEYRVVCVGGDTTSSEQFFCSITVWGEPAGKKAILRSGAQPDDLILVTGVLGGSIKQKHFSFTPRVQEGQWLAQRGYPNAMMDVSDGLAQDLSHLLRASRVSAHLNLECVPLARYARNLTSAIADGEDFELLMTVSRKRIAKLLSEWKKTFPKTPLNLIGSVQRGSSGIQYYLNGKKQTRFRTQEGFRHF